MQPVKDRINKGIFGEARDIYERLVGEAKRSAQRDREAARRRGAVVKTLLAACLLSGVLAAATLVYGFITFRDAPIRKTAGGYVGKHGMPHTSEDYERFKMWEKLVAASFGLTFLTGFAAVLGEKMSQQRRGGK